MRNHMLAAIFWIVTINVTFGAEELYCVIDLSAGASASSYPVTYLDEPPSGGFNTDEYKTTKLVLRRIEPGTFMMCGEYETTLTKPYYIGVFEVTQKQYELVMGSNPSSHLGDTRPVEKVSYNMLRGASDVANWPASSAVSASSFIGVLRSRTGLDYDLPTEAQWEYACRAGTTSDYNDGGSAVENLKTLGRYSGDVQDGKGGYSTYHTAVGSYLPNGWDLYDMHGNVWEWCLDWSGNLSGPQTDPLGPTTGTWGTYRVLRGGSWKHGASDSTSSARRLRFLPSDIDDYYGFRLALSNIPPSITNVIVQARHPWDGSVAITYTLSDSVVTNLEQGMFPTLKISATDGMTGEAYEAATLSGDTSLAEGAHTLVWDMAADGLDFISSSVVFTVTCEMKPATYCVIDLSGGANASSYPVTYFAEPPSSGFNVDAYKTTKLVLRRIDPGTFMMCGQYKTTLTKPYYIGVFEMTQKQYQLVMGNNPSNFSGDKRPVEKVSYNTIRGSSDGAKWPASSAVDSSSFMGKIRARIGLDFDLPTEAQWEYACRAGTTTTYSYGDSADGNYMWYSANSSSQTHDVGTKLPNPWGLYDMHGNVWEWCLDWYGGLSDQMTDPKGSSSGSNRMYRSGRWSGDASYCTSSHRSYNAPSSEFVHLGFRLARPLIATSQTTTFFGGSAPTTIGLPSIPVISPAGGVVGSWPVSVTMSCATDGAVIHYTTDGTEPTAESQVYSRFRVYARTTVKAVAVKNGVASKVAVAEFAAGQCADPVVSPADGASFEHRGQEVSIAWSGADGVLRYTTDGSDPTASSPVYGGPFAIDETTVVKAKAFGDQFFDSAIVTARLARVWVNVATPVITAAASFTGSKTKVAISCATEGAAIRYTLNGNDPNSHASRYSGPFFVTDSCVVKAYAVRADYLDSAVAMQSIEKVWGVGDTLGAPDHVFTNGVLPFVRVTDGTAPLGESMKSGAITDDQTSTLSTAVMGPGTITFQWKTSCEKDPDDLYEWDHAEFLVDGALVARLDGVTGWQTVSYSISGDVAHSLEWRYTKDDIEAAGDDCCWVADYHWASDYTATRTTEVPVPYTWLRAYYPETPDEYDFYEAAAKEDGANGRNKVWECYVAGLVPTNASEVLRTVILNMGGTPVISWEPRLSAAEEAKRTYTIYGRESLITGEWTTPTNSLHRFFRVKVTMP